MDFFLGLVIGVIGTALWYEKKDDMTSEQKKFFEED